MLPLLQAAGWPIWPLLLCSMIVLAIIIERLIQLRAINIAPPGLLEQAIAASRQRPAPDALLEKLQKAGALGPVLASGIRILKENPSASPEDVRTGMEIAGRQAAQKLERYLSALGALASAAPLLGLLGTVIGMIEIFSAQQSGAQQPAQLAYGISIALYNTAFGLIVAIPALLFWRYFRSCVDRHLLVMEQSADRFARHLFMMHR